jgi:hypothetical protein
MLAARLGGAAEGEFPVASCFLSPAQRSFLSVHVRRMENDGLAPLPNRNGNSGDGGLCATPNEIAEKFRIPRDAVEERVRKILYKLHDESTGPSVA